MQTGRVKEVRGNSSAGAQLNAHDPLLILLLSVGVVIVVRPNFFNFIIFFGRDSSTFSKARIKGLYISRLLESG